MRLKKIDNILFELKLKSKIITKATFENLIERKNTQKENYNYQVVNDFCKFLISNEFKNIYYIDKKWHANKNYIPTILNDGELKKLFRVCDYLLQSHRNKRQYHGYCIIIRLLYSCG